MMANRFSKLRLPYVNRMIPLPNRYLRSLNSALDVAEFLGQARQPMGVTEVSEALGINKATVHAILSNLEYRGYVRKNSETLRYCLWTQTWRLGTLAGRQINLKFVARPHLVELTAATGEGSLLSVYSHPARILYLDTVPSPNPVRAYVGTGETAPCHCVATGKIILAFDKDIWREIETNGHLTRYTDVTITDTTVLAEHLLDIRKRGWAINECEYRSGIIGIAAPIFDLDMNVVAAVGISGPSYRINMNEKERLIDQVLLAADNINKNYTGSSVIRKTYISSAQ